MIPAQNTPRIFVAELYQETNTYNPILTGIEDFVIASDVNRLPGRRFSKDAQGGILEALRRARLSPGALFTAHTRSGGAVAQGAFNLYLTAILEKALGYQPNLILLSLHGCMATPTESDCEGVLLSRLRHALGPHLPICVSLDVEANVTNLMVQNATYLVGARSSLGAHAHQAGMRAAAIGLKILRGEINPVISMAKTPLLLPDFGENNGRLARLLAETAKRMLAENSNLIDISVFRGCQYADLPEMGGCVLATADGDSATASSAATALIHRAWQEWRDPRRPQRLSCADLRGHLKADTTLPIILGDAGDSVTAGAPGDSVTLLALLLDANPSLRGLFPVFDPAAVAACQEAAIGAAIEIDVGGWMTPSSPRLRLKVRIEKLGRGAFAASKISRGRLSHIGDYAVVTSGNQTLVITAASGFSHDPAFYDHAGCPPSNYDVVVAKSMFFFKSGFGQFGRCQAVATEGLSAASIVDHTADCGWVGHLSLDIPSGLAPTRSWTSMPPVAALGRALATPMPAAAGIG